MRADVVKAWTARVVLAVAVCAVLWLLNQRIAAQYTISHDDAISYVESTGHAREIRQLGPRGKWAKAGDWQAFWQPSKRFCLVQIGADLGNLDIHPPLYFWILHVWLLMVGVATSSGPSLNVLFFLAVMGAIYWGARKLNCSPLPAALASAVWGLSPSTQQVVSETRPYVLLSLVSVVFVVQILTFARNDKARGWVLVPLAALGMLTHYHFALIAAISGTVAVVDLWRHSRYRQILLLVCWGAAALLLTFLIHPYLHQAVQEQQKRAQPFAADSVLPRLLNVEGSVLELVLPRYKADQLLGSSPLAALVVMGTLFVLATVLGILLSRWLKRRASSAESQSKASQPSETNDPQLATDHSLSPPTMELAICGLGTIGLISTLYVLCFSPDHAMGPKYLSPGTPLLALWLASVWQSLVPAFCQMCEARVPFCRPATQLQICLAAGVLPVMLVMALHSTDAYSQLQDHLRSHSASNEVESLPLLLDATYLGTLPRALWNADPQLQVFADHQHELAESLSIEPGMNNLALVSVVLHQNTEQGRRNVLERCRELGFSVVESEQRYHAVDGLFLMNRKQATVESGEEE